MLLVLDICDIIDVVDIWGDNIMSDTDNSLFSKSKKAIKKTFKRIKNAITHPFTSRVEAESFSKAFQSARKSGKKTFIWANNENVYTTEYKGSPQEQMNVYGITDEQLHDRNFIQERLARNISPFSYDNPVERVWNSIVKNEKENISQDIIKKGYDIDSRLDYFSLYNGMPQKNSTLSISDYKYNDSKCAYCYKDNNLTKTIKEYLPHILSSYEACKEYNPTGQDILGNVAYCLHEDNIINDEEYVNFNTGRDLGNFSLKTGQDEKGCFIQYYDKWDISVGRDKGQELAEILLEFSIDLYHMKEYGTTDNPKKDNLYKHIVRNMSSEQITQLREKLIGIGNRIQRKANDINTDFGQPFEIYDRIYYDPETHQPIDIKEQTSANLKSQMKIDQQKAQNSANKIDEMFLDEMFTTPNTQNTSQQSSDNSFAVAQKVAKLKRSR